MSIAPLKVSATATPRPVNLPHLMAFEVAARHLNFTRAADELQVTSTAMSKTIKLLELQLGVRLFIRTTRSVVLTESGARLLRSLAPALAQIRSSIEQVSESCAEPSGVLTINTSPVAYAALIEPRLADFMTRFSDIQLDLQFDNGQSGIVSSECDAWIRLGQAFQRDVVGVPIGPRQQMIVVATSAYLDRHGTPMKPLDLLQQECLRQRLGAGGRFLEWNFIVESKGVRIDVQGTLSFDEMRPVLTAALAGFGLAYVFLDYAAEDLRAGRLVPVLEPYCQPCEAFHLYYPNRARMPDRLRAFIDFFQDQDRHLSR